MSEAVSQEGLGSLMDAMSDGEVDITSIEQAPLASNANGSSSEEPNLDREDSSTSTQLNPEDWLTDEADADAEAEDTQAGKNEEEGEAEETAQADGKEEIKTIKVKGLKTPIKVNFADRDSIVDLLKTSKQKELGAVKGMNKFRQERDEANQLKAELEADFSKLDEAFKAKGVRGVVEALNPDTPNAWQRAVDQELQERERLALMDPAERLRHEQAQAAKAATEREKQLKEEHERALQELRQEREQHEIRDIQTKGMNALSKYGFSGKLGREAFENKLNKMLWTDVMETLDELPEDTKVTQAMLDKEFRVKYAQYVKDYGITVEKRVAKQLNKAKDKALTNARAAVRKGQAPKNKLNLNNLSEDQEAQLMASFFK